MNKLHAQKMVS